VGDKTFSNFIQLSYSGFGGFTPPNASFITVTPSDVDATHHGFILSGSLSASSPRANSFLDIAFSYIVTSTSVNIKDIELTFNASVQGTGNASISESAFTNPGNVLVGNVSVSNPPGGSSLQATIDLTGQPYQSIRVEKDIFLSSGSDFNSGNAVQIFTITQIVSQTVVPEPSTILLLGSGLAGLVTWGRKRKA
jgi:hypothetical protein